MVDDNGVGCVLVEVWNCGVGSTAFPVQIEVAYYIRDPPYPSNTSILGITMGGSAYSGTAGVGV